MGAARDELLLVLHNEPDPPLIIEPPAGWSREGEESADGTAALATAGTFRFGRPE